MIHARGAEARYHPRAVRALITALALSLCPAVVRAQAQPMRLDTTVPVCCYRYAQGRPALEAADERWQGRTAYLHYFLP